MRKFLFVLTVLVCSSLFAADVWETQEEIDINGVIAEKSVVISDNVMKVVNTSPNGETETYVDLNADKITIITHKYKTFQTFKISKYIEFAQQLFNVAGGIARLPGIAGRIDARGAAERIHLQPGIV